MTSNGVPFMKRGRAAQTVELGRAIGCAAGDLLHSMSPTFWFRTPPAQIRKACPDPLRLGVPVVKIASTPFGGGTL